MFCTHKGQEIAFLKISAKCKIGDFCLAWNTSSLLDIPHPVQIIQVITSYAPKKIPSKELSNDPKQSKIGQELRDLGGG